MMKSVARIICLLLIETLYWVSPGEIMGQSVCLPLPRLLTTMPMGGTVGSQVEVTVTGEHIDEGRELLFNHPGIKAIPKKDANGQVEANKFLVTIDPSCPAGLYEARLYCRLGISSARIFSVDTRTEVQQKSPNTSLATAMELPTNSVCNAVMTPKSVDHYRFEARRGQRYSIYCAARGIDSKLDPVVIIADHAGRDLVVERRGDLLDFTATTDGPHVIKIHELTFKGGPAYFYRLFLQELAQDANVPMIASTRTVSSFSWPPEGLAEKAAMKEQEDAPEKGASEQATGAENAIAQRVTLPCDIEGAFYPAADVDLYEFEGKKGETWWIEVASERLGRPTDPSLLIQRAVDAEGRRQWKDVTELADIAAPMKPSSNGYSYDGPPYDGGSADILGKLDVPEDGLYRLQLSDLFGGTRVDSRNRYRMVIRKGAPDFALAAWGLHFELRNGDRNALSKPLALRCGATIALEVVVVRRDGFQGPIQLSMEGLPDGVTAHGLSIPEGKSRGILLLTAHQDAPNALANVSFYGEAQVGEATLRRKVHLAQMAWPVPDAWSEIPSPRLIDGVMLSVSSAEYAPISIAGREKVIEATVGQKVPLPFVHTKRSGFSGANLKLKAFGEGFEKMPPFDVALEATQSDASIDLASLKIQPGDYLLSFYGNAVVQYKAVADKPPQDTVEIIVTEPITLRVKPAESK